MYASAWPGLSPIDVLRRPRAARPPFPLDAPRKTYFFRARNALYHLFKGLGLGGRDRVLVPDYHSGNEVAAIRAAGAGLTYYPVTRRLEVDLDALARRCTADTRAVLVIHYLGWPQPMAELGAFCRQRGLLLVEDCALSLLSEDGGVPLGATGDFSVFCLYKTLAVPNGAVLVDNRPAAPALGAPALRRCGLAPLAGRTAELLLEWLRGRCDAPGRALFALKRAAGRRLRAAGVERLPVGDMGFDPEQVDVALSPLCEALLRRWDYEAIRRRRRENFALLRERLMGAVPLLKDELPGGACPLFFPVLAADKAAAARALRSRGVDAVEFWNEGDREAPSFPAARFLRDHVLELPLHQDLSPAQVEYVAEQVLSIPFLHSPKGGLQ
jgi:dTDP-4-amino-4,6-dideoxygalactose transaminase